MMIPKVSVMKYYSTCPVILANFTQNKAEARDTLKRTIVGQRVSGLFICRLPASDLRSCVRSTDGPGWPHRTEATCIGRTQGLMVFLCYYLNSVSYWGLHMWLQINPFSSENLVLKNSCVSLLNSLIIYPPWYVKPFISVVNCQEYTELLRSCSKQYKHLIGHLKTPHGEPGSMVVPNAVGSMEVVCCQKFFVGLFCGFIYLFLTRTWEEYINHLDLLGRCWFCSNRQSPC